MFLSKGGTHESHVPSRNIRTTPSRENWEMSPQNKIKTNRKQSSLPVILMRQIFQFQANEFK